MIVIGSRAAKYHIPDFREPKDWDLLGTWNEIKCFLSVNKGRLTGIKIKDDLHKLHCRLDGIQVEVEMAEHGTSAADLSIYADKVGRLSVGNYGVRVPSLAVLTAIKRSHLEYPIRWQKSIVDYHQLKSRAGELSIEETKAIALRSQEIAARAAGKLPKVDLNVSNDKFFKKSQAAVGRLYEHDDLHRATCFYDKPLFETLKDDKSKAFIPKKNFDKLPLLDKVRLVQEECFAIGLERMIIPGKTNDPKEAFDHAIQRICTTLCKGWFRDFAIENYPAIINYDRDFVTLFRERYPDE